jgi:RimJ/RimL family protein N-acetyltransferase/SAM-dependent methyltransferase
MQGCLYVPEFLELPLRTARLELRELQEQDAAALFGIFSDAEAMKYWSEPAWVEPDAAVQWVARSRVCMQTGTALCLVLAPLSGGPIVGYINIYAFVSQRAEIGYILDRAAWGKGLMNEALAAVLRYSFDLLKLRRIEADIDPRNERSVLSLERLGFSREGFLRERWEVGGEISDSVLYGLLARDWMARDKAFMNRDSYNKIARTWASARNKFFGREREYIDAVLSVVPAGSTILDMGCGTGYPMADYIVSQGLHILGVDQSEEMLAIARQNLPQERWMLSSMEAYEPEEGYQGALLWDSLFHIPRTEHESILRKVVCALPSGGRLMLTVGGSAHPAFTDIMYGEEFYYDSNTPEETEQLLQRLGCRLVIAEYMNIPDGGRDKGRYAIVAEKG